MIPQARILSFRGESPLNPKRGFPRGRGENRSFSLDCTCCHTFIPKGERKKSFFCQLQKFFANCRKSICLSFPVPFFRKQICQSKRIPLFSLSRPSSPISSSLPLSPPPPPPVCPSPPPPLLGYGVFDLGGSVFRPVEKGGGDREREAVCDDVLKEGGKEKRRKGFSPFLNYST